MKLDMRAVNREATKNALRANKRKQLDEPAKAGHSHETPYVGSLRPKETRRNTIGAERASERTFLRRVAGNAIDPLAIPPTFNPIGKVPHRHYG